VTGRISILIAQLIVYSYKQSGKPETDAMWWCVAITTCT